MSVTVQVTFDAHEPERLGRFWAFALGYESDAPPPGFATWDAFAAHHQIPPEEFAWAIHDPEGAGPRLFFQRVPEPKTAKNRVHLDLRAAPGLRGAARMSALAARAQELVSHGATQHRVVEATSLNQAFIVMTDPEGNEFCLD